MSSNFDTSDVICSISTPQGVGAIAIVRISGSNSLPMLRNLFIPVSKNDIFITTPRRAYFGQIINSEQIIDQVVVTWFRAPASYTGEDMIEIACHGSHYIQSRIMQLLIDRGCRPAKPGEFTMRAFLNGKMELTQAEAVADLINARSAFAHKIAITQVKGAFTKRLSQLSDSLLNLISLVELELDFSEEDVEFADRSTLRQLVEQINSEAKELYNSYAAGQAIKSGIPVAIVGQPNAGKSTLLNKILKDDRALVSDIPGTTRDSIEDIVSYGGIEFRFIDTAGLRSTTDSIEQMGIERSIDKISSAWIIIFLFDLNGDTEAIEQAHSVVSENVREQQHTVIVGNKADLMTEEDAQCRVTAIAQLLGISNDDVVLISARSEQHVDMLIERLIATARTMLPAEDSIVIHNSRQYGLLSKILSALDDTVYALDQNMTGDLLAFELRRVLALVGELTGTVITPDMVLGNIFKNFCIGK